MPVALYVNGKLLCRTMLEEFDTVAIRRRVQAEANRIAGEVSAWTFIDDPLQPVVNLQIDATPQFEPLPLSARTKAPAERLGAEAYRQGRRLPRRTDVDDYDAFERGWVQAQKRAPD